MIPSLNQGCYLESTLKSIYDQKYNNLEVILIDGGSTDNTFKVLEKFIDKIDVIEIKPKLSQVEAINHGLIKSTGVLVGWQNTDDLYAINTFEEIAYLYMNNPKYNIFTGDISLIDKNGKIRKRLKYITPNFNYLVNIGMVMASQSTFWKKSIHNEVGILDGKYNYSFDYDWFLRITKKYSVLHSKKVLGFFRMHENSKSYLQKIKFDEENDAILKKYKKVFIGN